MLCTALTRVMPLCCMFSADIAKNCPSDADGGADGGEKVKPVAAPKSAAKPVAAVAAAKGKRKATASEEAAAPTSDASNKKQKPDPSAAAPAAAPVAAASVPTKKNKNNRHKDVVVPKHLRDGEADDKQFDKLAAQYKQKFNKVATAAPKTAASAATAAFKLNPDTLKSASRWFD